MKRISFFLLLFLGSCLPKNEVGYAHLLKEKEIKPRQIDNLPFEYTLFRESDTSCKLYYRINSKHFLPIRDSAGNWFMNPTLAIVVQNNQFTNLPILKLLKDTVISKNKVIYDSCNFYLPAQRDVYLEMKLMDGNKHVYQMYPFWWVRNADFIEQDLTIWNLDSLKCETNSFVNPGKLSIRQNNALSTDLKIDVYQNIFQAAAPMYENQDIRNKRIHPVFDFHGTQEEISAFINALKVESYCRIYPLNELQKGRDLSKFSFTRKVVQSNFLMEPMCYLLSDNRENSTPIDVKTWLQFWAKASSNDPQIADRLIKEFNRRVQYANDKFGSYKEGWKTDRGMMYILLGAPDRVQEGPRGEQWLYGMSQLNNTQFSFVRNPHDLNKYDFVLERSVEYRQVWQEAIQKWENGWVKIGNY